MQSGRNETLVTVGTDPALALGWDPAGSPGLRLQVLCLLETPLQQEGAGAAVSRVRPGVGSRFLP